MFGCWHLADMAIALAVAQPRPRHHAAHTMRGPNAGAGASSGQWLTSAYLTAFRLFRHGRKPGIGMLSIPALRQRAARD